MKLSDFELAVMQVFWLSGETSAPQIHQKIEMERNASYATVKTMINRLEEKGAIERSRLDGRTIYYSPLVSADEIKKPLFKSFIKSVFGNERRTLFNHVIKEQSITKEDIEYLEAILAEKKQELDQK
ncbi:MAG: BlaI/MecI/CopY family transcriptional regulator [Kangiellaceae bacterium]